MLPSFLRRKNSARVLMVAASLAAFGCAVAVDDEPGTVLEEREHGLDRAETLEGAEPDPMGGVIPGRGEVIVSAPGDPGKPTPDPWLEEGEPGKPTPDPWKSGSGSGSGSGSDSEGQGSQSASSGK